MRERGIWIPYLFFVFYSYVGSIRLGINVFFMFHRPDNIHVHMFIRYPGGTIVLFRPIVHGGVTGIFLDPDFKTFKIYIDV